MQDERAHHDGSSCCGACEYAQRVASNPTLERAPPAAALITRAGAEGIALVVTEKGGSPRRLEFSGDSVTVGRTVGNDVVLPKGNVSKRTCRFFYEDRQLCVMDLKSTCGTYVNGRLIHSATALRVGDKIYVGDFVLTAATL